MVRLPLALALVVLTLPSPAFAAREVAGVLLPDRARVSPDSPPLRLNGAGVHTRYLFIELYVAALYLPAQMNEPQLVLAEDGPRRLFLHFLRDAPPDRAHRLWDKLGANGGRLQQLGMRRDQFMAVFSDGLKKGDEIAFDYLPGQGTYIRMNGHTKAVIPGEDFYHALLRLWLGPKPASQGLKRDLLGSAS